MTQIDVLSAIEGRKLLNNLFHKIRYERQRSGFASLFLLWRICVSNPSVINSLISYYLNKDIKVLHKLGFIRGTILWLEEIVNRFYFSTFTSFVYFGAAVVLVLVGLNRFSDIIDDRSVIYGFCFEAAMLIFIFIIMLFSSNDDVTNLETDNDNDFEKELLNEIGEISKDFAITSIQLDKITNHFLAIVDRQNELSDVLKTIVEKLSDVQNPTPKVIETMQNTNEELNRFNSQLTTFIDATNKLKQEEISNVIRRELEKIISNKITE